MNSYGHELSEYIYGYRGLPSLLAVLLIIFEVMTHTHICTSYIHTHYSHIYTISNYRLGPFGRMENCFISNQKRQHLQIINIEVTLRL